MHGGLGVWESHFLVIVSIWFPWWRLSIIFYFSKRFLQPLVFRGACSFFLSSSGTWPSCILSFLFIMTVVVPLSAFLMCIFLVWPQLFKSSCPRALRILRQQPFWHIVHILPQGTLWWTIFKNHDFKFQHFFIFEKKCERLKLQSKCIFHPIECPK